MILCIEDGKILTVGNNELGQLGNGNREASRVPVKVEALSSENIVMVDAGLDHNLALTGIDIDVLIFVR
jgi:alpha-tubulin suppressor-like RCC1 family protein